jgi:hypothetical protein
MSINYLEKEPKIVPTWLKSFLLVAFILFAIFALFQGRTYEDDPHRDIQERVQIRQFCDSWSVNIVPVSHQVYRKCDHYSSPFDETVKQMRKSYEKERSGD